MKDHRYFIVKTPTTIATCKLGVPQHTRDKWAKEAYKYNSNNQTTNVKAQMSSYYIFEETDSYNKLLGKIIETITKNQDHIRPIGEAKFKIYNAWTAIYRENNYTVNHHHSSSSLSFVYYIKGCNKSSPLVFPQCTFQVNPEDDLLVIFDSTLVHNVPVHKGPDRIVLAGNVTISIKP